MLDSGYGCYDIRKQRFGIDDFLNAYTALYYVASKLGMDETLDMQGMTRDGHALLVLTIVLLVTTWVVLVLRLGVRGFILRSLGWDDATLFLSGVCIARVVFCIVAETS